MIYTRRACYHETDKMGIIHHSNYIKWLEEARIWFLASIGVPYLELEKSGIVSPVLHVEGDYVKSLYFDSMAYIDVEMISYTGIKFEFSYVIRNEEGDICFRGKSKHCLLKDNGVVSLRSYNEKWDRILRECVKA